MDDPPEHSFRRLILPEDPEQAQFVPPQRWPRGLTEGEIWRGAYPGHQLRVAPPIPAFLAHASALALAKDPFDPIAATQELITRGLLSNCDAECWPFPLRLTWRTRDSLWMDVDMIESESDEHGHELMVRASVNDGPLLLNRPYHIHEPINEVEFQHLWGLGLSDRGRAWLWQNELTNDVGSQLSPPSMGSAGVVSWTPPPGFVGVKRILHDATYRKEGKNPSRSTIQQWERKEQPPKRERDPQSGEIYFPKDWVDKHWKKWKPRH